MKILMVNKFLYPNGGSETYIFRLGEQLIKMGHEVQYFGMEHECRCVGNSAEQYTKDMDFHTASTLKKLSYPLKTIYSADAKKKITIVLKYFQPDIVHLNNFNYQLTPSIITAVREYEKKAGKKIKIVYTAHDYQLICPNHMLYNNGEICENCLGGKFINCTKGRCIHSSLAKSVIGTAEGYFWKMKGIYKNIDLIICPTEFMKKKLDTNPIFADKTVTLLNFVQPEKITEPSKKDRYVLYFGRFDEEKGVKLFKKLTDIKMICAGSGNLEEFINSLPNAKNVGFKSGEELKNLIKNAVCSVYPSVWYENCPFSVMESIMLGTPVVGADIGGIPELIDDGKTGLLFEPNNAEDFENKIKTIIKNPALAEEMSRNCLDKKFDTVCEYTEKLLNLYKI